MTKLRSTKYPLGHILNPAKKYVHSSQTDIAETFRRIREEHAKEQNAKLYTIKARSK